MIRNVILYNLAGGRLDKTNYQLIKEIDNKLQASIPLFVDITFNKIVIHFKKSDFSYARPYGYEKSYIAKVVENRHTETFEPYCYQITFNNPCDSEKSVSFYIRLTRIQNIGFCIMRLMRWFRDKKNVLWLANIIVLLLSIISFCFQ